MEKFIERITLALLLVGLCVAIAIFAAVLRSDQLLCLHCRQLAAALGTALRADGISAAMILTIAVIVCAIALYARSEFGQQNGKVTRASYAFWTLLLGIWSGLNAVALGADLFKLLCCAGIADLCGGAACLRERLSRKRSRRPCATCFSR